MKTFVFVQKNGNATITLSAEDEADAYEGLELLGIDPDAFRLEDEEDEDIDESMDGDFDSSMTSAGMGTDENYMPGEMI